MIEQTIFTKQEQTVMEQIKAPMAVMQLSDERISPVLVTDGLCKFFKMSRIDLMEYLSNNLGALILDEDYPVILDAYKSALVDPLAPIDIEYRFRTSESEDYFWVRNIGTNEKRDNGIYITYLTYCDSSKFHNTKSADEILDDAYVGYVDTKNNQPNTVNSLNKYLAKNKFFYWIYDVNSNLIANCNCFEPHIRQNAVMKDFPQFVIDMKLIHPDDVSKYLFAFNTTKDKALEAQEIIRIFDHSDRTYKEMNISFIPVMDEANNLDKIIGTARVNNTYKEMFSLLRSILNKNELITWNYIIDKKEYNFEHNGFASKQMQLHYDLIYGAIQEGTIKNPEEILNSKKTNFYKIVDITNGFGRVYKFEISYSVFKIGNRPYSILGMARNVTQYYEMETKYIKELEKANCNKAGFLSRLSHDMRTPLGAISSLSEFGLEEVNDQLAHNYFSKIKDNSEYLLSFITDILESRKISDGKMEFKKVVFNSKDIFPKIVSVIQLRANDKNIDIQYEWNETFFEHYLVGDIAKIKQVAINLLSNAIKYTPRGGTVKVRSDGFIEGDKMRACISISDNGVGMSKEFQGRMFEEFTQEHNKLSFEEEGSGVGLSIVKNIIDLSGGTIECESELDKGTTFTVNVTLPIATQEQIDEYNSKVKNLDFTVLTGKRILICEDKTINIAIESKLLMDKNMIIDLAANGLVGLQKAKKNNYDAILMDIRMPVMDGLTATREIRKFDSNTPIIAVSANASEEDVQISLKNGMNAHISKPINKDELYSTLFHSVTNRECK